LKVVGLDRSQCYVTNAVKHFKWKPRGKRRIHEKPSSREIEALNARAPLNEFRLMGSSALPLSQRVSITAN